MKLVSDCRGEKYSHMYNEIYLTLANVDNVMIIP